MAELLRVSVPMPPSVNKLYFVRHGRKVLSAQGRTVKAQIQALVTQAASQVVGLNEQTPLELEIVTYFPVLENKGWSQGKSKSRYKKIDVTNRAKLLEDALSGGLGLDDSLFFRVTMTKREGAERAEIILRRYHEQDRSTPELQAGGTHTPAQAPLDGATSRDGDGARAEQPSHNP
jgi:Holliday junction resolvase RusA-like endonuclease